MVRNGVKMALKRSDSCSNGSIAAQRDEIARQLVAAVTQCQDAPAVAGQQAEIQSEIEFIEAILGPIIKENRQRRKMLKSVEDFGVSDEMFRSYISNWSNEEQHQQLEEGLERPLEQGAAFAKETKNRALAKAVRHVRAALAGVQGAWGRPNQAFRQAFNESHRLFSKVEDRLRQLRDEAEVHLTQAQTRATEISAWKKQQTDLQEAAHALAAVRRVPEAPEDEGA